MKKSFINILGLILLIGFLAFTSINYEIEKNSGEVKQIEGLYIFFASEPLMKTEYIGTVKVGMTLNSDSDTRLSAIIKKCKKNFPNAEAVIFKSIDFSSADAVKYIE